MLGLGRLCWVGRSGSTLWNNPTNLTDPTGFIAGNENGGSVQFTDENSKKKEEETCDKRCQQLEKILQNTVCRLFGCHSNENGLPKGKDDSGGKGQNTPAANKGASLGNQTTLDGKGKGNGYDTSDPYHHNYQVVSGICAESTSGCTVQNVTASIAKNAAPGSDGETTVVTGARTPIKFLGLSGGTVTHISEPNNSRVINITETDHVFHSGIVIRSVVSQGGILYVVSNGEGVNRPSLSWMPNALSKALNLITYYPGFKMLDRNIQKDVLNQSAEGKAILQQQQIRRLESGYHGM